MTYTTVAEAIAAQREAQAEFAALEDEVPNLRDFGLDRRADYEAAHAAWLDRRNAAHARAEDAVRQRMALLRAGR